MRFLYDCFVYIVLCMYIVSCSILSLVASLKLLSLILRNSFLFMYSKR